MILKKGMLILLLFTFSFSLGKAQEDTINFEFNYPYSSWGTVTIDSITGIWEVGAPNKNTFTQALSLPNAIITDSVSVYPTNNDSYIYFHVDKNISMSVGGGFGYAILGFSYQLETDSLNDYGSLEVFDGSSQWVTVNNGGWVSAGFQYYSIEYLSTYDLPTFYSGLDMFTGNTSIWNRTKIKLQCQGIFQPTDINRGSDDLYFRFHFHSDSNPESKDGWMIDNIIWENFVGGCFGGVEEYLNQIQLSAYPTLSNGKITFESANDLFSQISIYDYNGKQIESFNFQKTSFKTLELSQLASGMYFYTVDGGAANGRFVIEK